MVSQYVVPTHLERQIDGKSLSIFNEQMGVIKSGSKGQMLVGLINHLNREDKTLEVAMRERQLYTAFLLANIRYSVNRHVLETFIEYPENSLLNKFEENISVINENEVNAILDPFENDQEFELLFKKAISNEHTKEVFYVFGRSFDYRELSVDGSDVSKKFIYITVSVRPDEQKMFITYPEFDANDTGMRFSPKSIFYEWSNLISRELTFIVDGIDDSNTLYKMYRLLTKNEEALYENMVNPLQDKLNEFIKEATTTLRLSNDISVNLHGRVRTELVRAKIFDNFEEFRSRQLDSGRVQFIRFIDPTGGRVDAFAAGHSAGRDLNLQDSTVYFDTKESIIAAKKLKGITVEWTDNPFSDTDSRYDSLNVKYTAYDNFLETHFMFKQVTEEVAKNVLSKIDGYRKATVE